MQASILDCEAFDPFPFAQDFRSAPKVDVGGREIAQALMIAAMIVVLDKGADLRLELARKIIVFEENAVLERLMPTLDLALRLRMQGRAADMLDVVVVEPCRQIAEM